jgi:hypothetical protein
MSADNGIYILETLAPNGMGTEYRVKHQLAVENVDWDNDINDYTEDHKVRIENAREMWKDCEVFTETKNANKEAKKIQDEIGWTEYGICLITIPEIF